MGLLEDAIRDHLELKRKHGASDEELLREEADALGPARREQPYVEQPEPQPGGDGAVREEQEEETRPERKLPPDLDFD